MTSQAHQPIPRTASDRFASSADAGASGCEQALLDRVGDVLRRLDASREVSDEELRRHAVACGALMLKSYQLFQGSGRPEHREMAREWLQHRDNALRELRDRGTSVAEGSAWFASDEAQAIGRHA